MKIYNSITRNIEILQVLIPREIKVYMCGITVYNFCHIGHARNQMAADFIIRYLKYKGYSITWARNITDIDDKIIHAAYRSNIDVTTLSNQMITEMHKDFNDLGLLTPQHEPRATEHIPDMINMIQELITKGSAYVRDGSVWFDISSCPSYGCFRHTKSHDPDADFVLWKKTKSGEPSYPSPWGAGRPGWHIECSAMSTAILGRHFDLHIGGKDLIFPHHENEIAQSFMCHGCMPARYWMHIGLLQIEGRKMSKSLNNFIDIKTILITHTAQVIRFFLMQTHYRHDVSYTPEKLVSSSIALHKLLHSLHWKPDIAEPDKEMMQEFESYMDDDFNTPEVCTMNNLRSNRCPILEHTIL
jgi:cysteinyl-tRNA synthetase